MNIQTALSANQVILYRLPSPHFTSGLRVRLEGEFHNTANDLAEQLTILGEGQARRRSHRLFVLLKEAICQSTSYDIRSLERNHRSPTAYNGRNIYFELKDPTSPEQEIPEIRIELPKPRIIIPVDAETGKRYLPFQGDSARDFTRLCLPITESTLAEVGSSLGAELLNAYRHDQNDAVQSGNGKRRNNGAARRAGQFADLVAQIDGGVQEDRHYPGQKPRSGQRSKNGKQNDGRRRAPYGTRCHLYPSRA